MPILWDRYWPAESRGSPAPCIPPAAASTVAVTSAHLHPWLPRPVHDASLLQKFPEVVPPSGESQPLPFTGGGRGGDRGCCRAKVALTWWCGCIEARHDCWV